MGRAHASAAVSTRFWRTLLLTLCTLTALQTAYVAWVNVRAAGDPGISLVGTWLLSITTTPTKTPFIGQITVVPSGPAFRAGLRSGDFIDLRRLSAADRYRVITDAWLPGQRIDIPVLRGKAVRLVPVVARPFDPPWHQWLYLTGILWMLASAALIARRRADSTEARMLALVLIFYCAGQDFNPTNFWLTRWPLAGAALTIFGILLWCASPALLARYAMLIAPPPSFPRRALAALSYCVAAFSAIVSITAVVGACTLAADPAQPWYFGAVTQTITNVLLPLLPVACVIVTVIETHGVERLRAAWTIASLGFLFLVTAAVGALVVVNYGSSVDILNLLVDISTFLAPLGLTYAFLNRRLLDIGFAINRAAVFSTVSVVVLGVFVLFEWILSESFKIESHTTNLVIGASLALLLGLSIRAIHRRVDRILDNVFFRRRHDDEKAIRTFAMEVPYITDGRTIMDRAADILEQHADAVFVDFVVHQGDHNFGYVGENDAAIVALRAWRKVLDLHTVPTGLRGEFAYPMVARGQLVGALVVGPKRSGESYAPDESDAIAQLAHEVGAALDAAVYRDDQGRDDLLHATAALLAGMQLILQKLDALTGAGDGGASSQPLSK